MRKRRRTKSKTIKIDESGADEELKGVDQLLDEMVAAPASPTAPPQATARVPAAAPAQSAASLQQHFDAAEAESGGRLRWLGPAAAGGGAAATRAVFGLRTGEKLAVEGFGWIHVLRGAVMFGGFKLQPEHGWHRLLLPPQCRTVAIWPAAAAPDGDARCCSCTSTVAAAAQISAAMDLDGSGSGAVVLIEGASDKAKPWTQCLAPLAPDAGGGGGWKLAPGCNLMPPEEVSQRVVTIPEDWAAAVAHVERVTEVADTSMATIIVGRPNTGKSTLGLHLANSLLQRGGHVAFLDLDPGQCEFTPPGFVSLVLLAPPLAGAHASRADSTGPIAHLPAVPGPVVGSAHTHLTGVYGSELPVLSFFVGATSPESDPTAYRTAVDSLVGRYFELAQAQAGFGGLPLVVNTMGWIRGLGLELLAAAAASIRPRLVLSLTRKPDSDDAEASGGRRVIDDTPQMQAMAQQIGATCMAIQPGGGRPGRAAVENRALALMSYFNMPSAQYGLARFLPPHRAGATPLAERRPFAARWIDLRIAFSHEPVAYSEVLIALNGALVGLCIDSNQYATANPAVDPAAEGYPALLATAPLCPAVGLGIVTHVDPVARQIHLLTPLDPMLLAHVNTLVRGQLNLPAIALRCGTASPIPPPNKIKCWVAAAVLLSKRPLRPVSRSHAAPNSRRNYGDVSVPYFVKGSLAAEGTGAGAGEHRCTWPSDPSSPACAHIGLTACCCIFS